MQQAVPVIDARCTAGIFDEFSRYRNRSPCVITNFASALEWKAPASWCDTEILRGLILDDDAASIVPVSCITDGSRSFDSLGSSQGSVTVKKMQWGAGVDAVFGCDAGSRHYLKSFMCPALRRDIESFPDALLFGKPHHAETENIKTEDVKVWVGSKGNVTPLHFDLCHGLIVQVMAIHTSVTHTAAYNSFLHVFIASTLTAVCLERLSVESVSLCLRLQSLKTFTRGSVAKAPHIAPRCRQLATRTRDLHSTLQCGYLQTII